MIYWRRKSCVAFLAMDLDLGVVIQEMSEP